MPRLSQIALPGFPRAVSSICLGGLPFGARLDPSASHDLLDAFADHGGNFVDTASVYCDWLPDVERHCSEKTLGRWLSRRPGNDVYLATKGGHPGMDAPDVSRLTEGELRKDVSRSLDNLGVERIALYYLHRDDQTAPVAALLEPVARLLQDGLIANFGLSNWQPARIRVALDWCRDNAVSPPIANQPEWSVATPRCGAVPADMTWMSPDMRQMHTDTGLAVVPFGAQARGYFDKLAQGNADPGLRARYDTAATHRRAREIAELAKTTDASHTQIALALLLRAPLPVVPIVGCNTPAQLAECVAATLLQLPLCDRDVRDQEKPRS